MDEEYVEAVLDLVASIPPGRTMTYGAIAAVLGQRLGRGGPRIVGQIMSRYGGDVPWWRVINASGRVTPGYSGQALAHLRAEGCPLTGDGERADRQASAWLPDSLVS